LSKLPNSSKVVIPTAKIIDYLLSLSHSSGRSKAIFFTHFGFKLDEWEILAEALRRHAAEHEVSKAERTPFGLRYVIEGAFVTPDNRNPLVRSVWFIDNDSDETRFVTAYPMEEV